MIEGKTFEAGTEIPADTEYRRCNFRRLQPIPDGEGSWKGHQLFPDNVPRTFINCHLLNCEVPTGSTVVNCNTAIADTRVVGEVEETIVDGVVVSRIQRYNSVVYGWYNDTQQRVLLETPDVTLDASREVEI